MGAPAAASPAAFAGPSPTRTARRGRNMAPEAALERQEAVSSTTALYFLRNTGAQVVRAE